LPDNRSFLEIVNGARAPSRSTPAPAPRRRQHRTASTRAFAFRLSWSATACAGAAILALCAAIYGTVGYVDEKRIADVAREAAEPAAARIDNVRIDNARIDGARIGTASVAKPPLAAPESAATDRTAALVVALGPADPRLPDPQAATVTDLLRWDTAKGSDGHIARFWAHIGTREAEEQLERLSADYAELVGERDRLRERVRELEQMLSLSQAPQPPPQTARLLPDNSFGASSAKPGAAAIAFPGAAAAAEQSRQVQKNFTPPGSVPNYFSDESGAILGSRGTR